jgi:hypothetical protein
MVQSIQIRALSNDAQVVIHSQHLGGACAKNCLRIGQDYLVHDARLI